MTHTQIVGEGLMGRSAPILIKTVVKMPPPQTHYYSIIIDIANCPQGVVAPPCHRLRIHRCATRGISCLTWMAWIRHTHAHFWQVQMQDFIRN